MITLYRIAIAGLRNFLRNAWLSTAATAVMTITLCLMTFSFISNSALTSTIKSVTDKIDVSMYLKDTVTQDQLTNVEGQLRAIPNVESITYISKADALANFRADNANDPTLQQSISDVDNPLPASIQVKVKDPNHLQTVEDFINKPEIKALQSDSPTLSDKRKVTVDRIIHFSNFFRQISLIASIIFLIISILIVFNTIRMAIFTRRSEIEIMKLVGATTWFIRGPFIVEAALYGIIAAGVALFFCYGLVLVGASKLSSYVDIAATVDLFRAHPFIVIFTEVLGGVAIGAMASFLAMSRYLKL